MATEKRPEKCLNCRRTEPSDGEHQFSLVQFVTVEVVEESDDSVRERAFEHFRRHGVADRTAGELAELLGTTKGYVRALRSEYRREQEGGSR